ncbi:hypothetical protein GYH30_021916 [Glycine max]|uniref:Uncharacterized protein n=1 Tax=Glycine max TaxID=3847 RepID=K7L7W6_SOYBN|nr:hypothetical protein GYH30_021916 [Glycine max]
MPINTNSAFCFCVVCHILYTLKTEGKGKSTRCPLRKNQKSKDDQQVFCPSGIGLGPFKQSLGFKFCG